jgi:chromosome segregation ATPase
MYFTLYWMDHWLRLMEACTAEQVRLFEASEQSKPAFDEEVAQLRREFADREQALSVAVQERQQLEANLDGWREMAAQRQVELAQAAEDSERQLQQEQTARAEAQAEVDRLRRQLRTAEAGRASAQQECNRQQAELTELRAQADRDRKGYDGRLAELTRAAGDSERQLQREQTARAEAQAERERLSGALKKVESERTAAQKEVERLQHQLTEALAQANRNRNDYEARLAAVDRQLAGREQRAAAQDSLLNASEPVRRTKSRTRATNVAAATAEPEAAGRPASSAESAVRDLELHFKKPADWAETVFVYYWDADPATEKLQWPGVPLATEADGWLVHRFSQIRSAHLVFNDNAGKQTQNLYRDRSGWLDADGTWHDDKTGDPALADR